MHIVGLRCYDEDSMEEQSSELLIFWTRRLEMELTKRHRRLSLVIL
jgi:hypothetical protein